MTWEQGWSFVIPLAIGYVAAVWTWPWIRRMVLGAEAEAALLKAKADALLAKVKGK